jgi:hypothetical protein
MDLTERIRVSYGRKLTQQIGSDFDSSQLGGEWEFDVPNGADVDHEYGKAYAVLSTIVDGFFEQRPKPLVPQRPVATQQIATEQPRALPGETITGAGSQWTQGSSDAPPARPPVEEGKTYEFTNQKVWEVKNEVSRNNKPYTVVRIGRKNGDIPGTGYARVKSYNPYMISRLSALSEGDLVDVTGVFEGWDGRDGRQYDFVPSAVDRVRDVRAG